MNSCFILCLTYAGQTWNFNENVTNKIITCQRGMERCILHIKLINKIRHTEIRYITKTTDGLTQVLTFKCKQAEHISRRQDQRWTKSLTEWRGPVGKRKKGRPYKRWQDDVKRTAGPNWMQREQYREKWLNLEEAINLGGLLTE